MSPADATAERRLRLETGLGVWTDARAWYAKRGKVSPIAEARIAAITAELATLDPAPAVIRADG